MAEETDTGTGPPSPSATRRSPIPPIPTRMGSGEGEEPRNPLPQSVTIKLPSDGDDGGEDGGRGANDDTEQASSSTPSKASNMKRNETISKRENSGNSAAAMRRQARRTFLQCNPESRTDSDLLFLDELLYGCQASKLLTRSARQHIARVATLATFQPDEVICSRDQDMHCVFLVLGGEISVEVISEAGVNQSCLKEGDSLGTLRDPLALEDPNSPLRPFTSPKAAQPTPRMLWGCNARAIGHTEAAMVTQEQWAAIMGMDRNWDARKLCSFLEDLSIFGLLSSRHLLQLARLVQFKDWKAGSVIYRQGSESDDMFIIRSGYVRLVRAVALSSDTRQSINGMTGTLNRLRDTLDMLAPLDERNQKRGNLYFAQVKPGADNQGLLSDDDGDTEASLLLPTGRTGSPLRRATAKQITRTNLAIKEGGDSFGNSNHGRPITAQDVSQAFVAESPQLLEAKSDAFVQMGSLGSGKVFGEVSHDSRPRRTCNAVADTQVQLLQLCKADIQSKLGDMVSYLWSQQPVASQPLLSDSDIRAEMEKTMKWEVYKKKLMNEVFAGKPPSRYKGHR